MQYSIFPSFLALCAANAWASTATNIFAGTRLFEHPGCSIPNDGGELTIEGPYANQCISFGEGQNITSLELLSLTEGCSLLVYEDTECQGGQYNVSVGECLSGGPYLGLDVAC